MHELLQHYHISERLRRATKRGKFSRAAYREFDFVLNLRHCHVIFIPIAQNIIS